MRGRGPARSRRRGRISFHPAELERRPERLCRLGRPTRVEQRLAEMLEGEVLHVCRTVERDAQARLGLGEAVEAAVRLAEADSRGRGGPLVPELLGERKAFAELRDRFLVTSEQPGRVAEVALQAAAFAWVRGRRQLGPRECDRLLDRARVVRHLPQPLVPAQRAPRSGSATVRARGRPCSPPRTSCPAAAAAARERPVNMARVAVFSSVAISTDSPPAKDGSPPRRQWSARSSWRGSGPSRAGRAAPPRGRW